MERRTHEATNTLGTSWGPTVSDGRARSGATRLLARRAACTKLRSKPTRSPRTVGSAEGQPSGSRSSIDHALYLIKQRTAASGASTCRNPDFTEPRKGAEEDRADAVGTTGVPRWMARLAGVEPAARGCQVRRGEDTGAPAASRSVTLRGVRDSPTSPNVQPRPANDGQFAALVLQGFSGKL